MAQRVPVWAKDVQLLAWKTDAYYPFACAERGRLLVGSEMLDTTTPSSGSWKTSMPAGVNEWEIEIGMVTVLRDLVNTFWFSWESILESVRKNRIQLKWKMTDRAGYEKYAVGYAWITETEIEYQMAAGLSGSTIKFLGDSYLDLSSLITPINKKVIRIPWTTTGTENCELQDNRLIGVTKEQVVHVSLEGDDKWDIIDTGTPVEGRQVKLDNAIGKLIWTITAGQFDANLYAYAIVDIV
jgi:hypothetical protein